MQRQQLHGTGPSQASSYQQPSHRKGQNKRGRGEGGKEHEKDIHSTCMQKVCDMHRFPADGIHDLSPALP